MVVVMYSLEVRAMVGKKVCDAGSTLALAAAADPAFLAFKEECRPKQRRPWLKA